MDFLLNCNPGLLSFIENISIPTINFNILLDKTMIVDHFNKFSTSKLNKKYIGDCVPTDYYLESTNDVPMHCNYFKYLYKFFEKIKNTEIENVEISPSIESFRTVAFDNCYNLRKTLCDEITEIELYYRIYTNVYKLDRSISDLLEIIITHKTTKILEIVTENNIRQYGINYDLKFFLNIWLYQLYHKLDKLPKLGDPHEEFLLNLHCHCIRHHNYKINNNNISIYNDYCGKKSYYEYDKKLFVKINIQLINIVKSILMGENELFVSLGISRIFNYEITYKQIKFDEIEKTFKLDNIPIKMFTNINKYLKKKNLTEIFRQLEDINEKDVIPDEIKRLIEIKYTEVNTREPFLD